MQLFRLHPEHAPQEALLQETTGAIRSLVRFYRSVMPGGEGAENISTIEKAIGYNTDC